MHCGFVCPTPLEVGLSVARSKNTYFSAKYRRLVATRGPMKALVQHSMITAAWTMLNNAEFYRDPGADYFTRHDPAKTKPEPSNNSKPSDTRSPSNHNSKPDSQLVHPRATAANTAGTEPHLGTGSPACRHLHLRVRRRRDHRRLRFRDWIAGEPGTV